ncbi:MAG: ATP-binding protein [Phormidesmis sp.]
MLDRISSQATPLTRNRLTESDISLSSQSLIETVFQPLFNQSSHFLWLLDADGRVLNANQAAIAFGKVELSQALKKSVYETWQFSQEEQVRLKAAIAAAAHGCTICYDALIQDESNQPVATNITLRETGQGLVNSVLILMEGTDAGDRPPLEKQQMEAQLLRNQRLQSVGNMTIGLAHDLGSLLTPLVGSAHLLRLEFPEADEQQKDLFCIIDTISNRANKLVQQMLSFTRGDAKKQSSIEIDYLLLDVETLIRSTFPESISIETNLPNGLWPVQGNENQLHQVLVNLCLNARDAMPSGGALTLSAENIQAADIQIDPTKPLETSSTAVSTDYVAIQVSDTGDGIPVPLLDSVFVPFFTTKAVGQGTGLGLSTVRDIIRNHGGFVDVLTNANPILRTGTRFRVYLPAS